jgi:hypothetical protein
MYAVDLRRQVDDPEGSPVVLWRTIPIARFLVVNAGTNICFQAGGTELRGVTPFIARGLISKSPR